MPTAPGTRPGSPVLPRSATGKAVAYDFQKPAKLSREHIRSLQFVTETFSRRLSTMLQTRLRQSASVNLVTIEQQTLAEYVDTLETPTFLIPLSIEPLPGTAFLEFSLNVALACVDYLLGGPGTGGKSEPNRQLTDIETELMTGLAQQMADEVGASLESIVSVRPAVLGIEYNTAFVEDLTTSETEAVASFELRVGSEDALATLCLPAHALFPKSQDKKTQGVRRDSADIRNAARRARTAMGTVPLDVRVRMDALALNPGQIVALRPGDVLPLGHPTARPLTVTTGGVTVGHAVAGKEGSRLAALVVDTSAEPSKEKTS